MTPTKKYFHSFLYHAERIKQNTPLLRAIIYFSEL